MKPGNSKYRVRQGNMMVSTPVLMLTCQASLPDPTSQEHCLSRQAVQLCAFIVAIECQRRLMLISVSGITEELLLKCYFSEMDIVFGMILSKKELTIDIKYPFIIQTKS